ncbi:ribonuclease HI family protein [Patescibacteria group bacterium]|nr:ribonuclease HI family protein [Patescibacteria group bacterium]
MKKEKIIMYTDGGSRNNPGPAAIGVYFSAQGGSASGGETLDKKYSECIGVKTNNEAEYEAVIFGLKKVKSLLGKDKIQNAEIECRLDSELVVKQLKHEYKIKEASIQKLFLEVWNLMLDFKSVVFYHIPREENKLADKLVNEALDQEAKQAKLI